MSGKSPSRVSQQREESPIVRDSEYYQYLRDSAQLNSSRKNVESSQYLNERNQDKMSPRASTLTQEYERQSQRSRSRSPTFTKELTDYRVDSGYRTVKKYDQSPSERRSRSPGDYNPEDSSQYLSPQKREEAFQPRGSKSRSRSPRFTSEITDYRISSNYRTIKTYDESTSPQRGRQREVFSSKEPEMLNTPIKQKESNLSAYDPTYSAGRRKSPVKFALEPTLYREETGYRTVKHFEKNEPQQPPQRESQQLQQREPESTIKESQEKPKATEDNQYISKKLEFEQAQNKK